MIRRRQIFLLIGLIVVFCYCTQSNDSIRNTVRIEEKCPCDSVGRFKEKGNNIVQYYLGKSQIETTDISANGKSDTIAISRYTYVDSIKKWRMQEMLWTVGEKLLPQPNMDFYCDIKDELRSYRITFIRNENKTVGVLGITIEKVIGGVAIIGKDTIHSNDSSIVIPKDKFKGMVRIDKIMQAVYKGQRDVFTGHMLIEAENMIRYGNILEQYKAFKKSCN